MVSAGSGGGYRRVVTRSGESHSGVTRTDACRPTFGIDVRRSGGRPRRGPPLPCHLACTPLVAAPPGGPPPASTTGRRTGRAGLRVLLTGSQAVSLTGSAIRGSRRAGQAARRAVDSWRGRCGVGRSRVKCESTIIRCTAYESGRLQATSSGGDHPAHRALGQPGRRGGHPRAVAVPHHVERGFQLRPQRVAGADQEHPPAERRGGDGPRTCRRPGPSTPACSRAAASTRPPRVLGTSSTSKARPVASSTACGRWRHQLSTVDGSALACRSQLSTAGWQLDVGQPGRSHANRPPSSHAPGITSQS